MSTDVTEIDDPGAETLLEFPGLPDVPEILDLRDPPAVLDLRDDPAPDDPAPDDPAPDDHPPPPDPPLPGGVPLHRFLDRAKPSLSEAAMLAAAVLEAIATMHEAGCTHGNLDSRSLQVGARGDVRLSAGRPEAPARTRFDPEQRRADLRAAAGIVAEIAKSAGRPARPLTEREEKLAARLAAAGDPRSLARRGALRASRGLEIAVGGADQRQSARQRLLTLIGAVTAGDAPTDTPHLLAGAGGWGPAVAAPGAGTAPGAPPPRRLPPPARRQPISPRVKKAAAVAAVITLVLGLEIHFFGDDVKRNVDHLLTGDAGATPAGPKEPARLPALGPPAAGPITHLELRPLEGCRPESVCQAVVQLAVAPQPAPLDVAWSFEFVDRCGPGRESRPGGVFSIPPGADRAVLTTSVAVPAWRHLGLIPVTTTPVRVAGTPLPLSASDGPC